MVKTGGGILLGAIFLIIFIISLLVIVWIPATQNTIHHDKCSKLLVTNGEALRALEHDPTEANIDHQKQTWGDYIKECPRG